MKPAEITFHYSTNKAIFQLSESHAKEGRDESHSGSKSGHCPHQQIAWRPPVQLRPFFDKPKLIENSLLRFDFPLVIAHYESNPQLAGRVFPILKFFKIDAPRAERIKGLLRSKMAPW